MRINADFSQRAVVKFEDNEWVASPAAGVERKMLDRIGGEVARATTIVRFAPGSAFKAHVHDGGEEFIVLEGVFQDEHGDFPQGSYIRNPPTSSHTPAAEQGVTILVKLHQFDPADRTHVRTDVTKAGGIAPEGRDGVQVTPLFQDPGETVSVEHWAAGADITLPEAEGTEVFVLDGSLEEGGDTLTRWDWLRLPDGAPLTAKAGSEGARVWIKRNHLKPAILSKWAD